MCISSKLACLDTTFLIDYLRGTERARIKYSSLRNNNELDSELLSVSIITAYELEKGAKLSKNNVKDLKLVRDLLSELTILNFDQKSIDLALDIYSDLSKKGRVIGEFDILIAATCLASNQSLITNDQDFDDISKLVKVHY